MLTVVKNDVSNHCFISLSWVFNFAECRSKIICEASKNESVKILMSMTGIDYFSAMLIASEIGDITRFSTPEKLISWAGLCPSIHQS